MSEQAEYLEFHLDERIYFESGQEIEEMLAISLDPDILVQSLADHVQIRGLIILSGEYRKSAVSETETDPDFGKILNYVEKVVDEDEDIARFTHRFPVEVSVPHDRVDRLDDITVSVEHFDYELPVNNTLHLKATVHIYGVNQGQTYHIANLEDVWTDDDVKSQQADVTEEEFRRKSEEFTEQMDHKDELEERESALNRSERDENVYSLAEHERNKQRKREKKDMFEESEMEAQILSGEQSSEASEETSTKDVEEQHKDVELDARLDESELSFEKDTHGEETLSEEESHSLLDESLQEESNATEDVSAQEESGIDIQLSEAETAEEDDEAVMNMTFLTELFNTGEETYATMKLYIVQSDDTVESIAKKYDISTLLLMKQNDIHSDSLEPGQILSIPVQEKKT